MKSSNPIFKSSAFEQNALVEKPMTVQGTINKSILLALILAVAGGLSLPYQSGLLSMGGAILGFILALVTTFKKEWSPITTPLYAAAEGVFLAGISMFFEAAYQGIAMQAILCTLSTMFMMLFAYKSGLIKVNEKFRSVLFVATENQHAILGFIFSVEKQISM